MFQVDDVIIYGSHGVCRIVELSEQRINGCQKTYYVLKPVQGQGATIFAPVDNENVRRKMRRLLSQEQIDHIIDTLPQEPEALPEKDSDRKELYRQLLAGSDPAQLMNMIQTVYLRRKQRLAEGKRPHMVDEYFFKDAEQILYNEFQYVLQLESKEALMDYIVSRMEKRSI